MAITATTTMRAALLTGIPSAALAFGDVPRPEPAKAGDLLVSVEACGLCTTDVHVLDGHSFRPDPPFVLGHEPVGTVIDVYSASDRSWLGRRITSSLFEGCGDCRVCGAGNERLCLAPRSVLGLLHAHGGYAEQMIMNTSRAVDVPDRLTSEAAASLVDSGSTAVNAARVGLRLGSTTPLIVGGGTIGQLVADVLALSGVRATILEPNAERRQVLHAMGHDAVLTHDELGQRPDLVYECSASPEAFVWAVDRLQPHGTLLCVGFPIVPEFHVLPVIRKELVIRGVRSGTTRDLKTVLHLGATKQIHLPAIIRCPLDEINTALQAVRAGGVTAKPVIDPR